MNDGPLNWLMGERTICIVGDELFAAAVADALRPLPLQVVAVSGEAAVVEIQAAEPDLVIVSGQWQEVGERLLAEPQTGHIGQLYVVAAGEEAAVWPLVGAHTHCDFVRASFTAEELQLRIHKLLSTLNMVNPASAAERFPWFDAIDEGILIFDETGHIVEVNRRACELYGRSYEALTQLQVGGFSAEEGVYVREEAWRRVSLAKTNGPQRFEWRSKRGDGQVIWVHVRITYLPLVDGRSCYVALVQDITSQKQLVEMLQEIRSQYGILIEHVYEGIIILQDRLIKVDNHGLSNMLGYTVDEVEGSPFIRYVAPAFQDEVVQLYGRFVDQLEVPYLNEVQLVHKDGYLLDVEISGAHTEYEGRPAVMAVVRNISNRKEAEQALQVSEDKFAKAFHASPDAIVIATWPEGVVLDVNHEFEQLTGYTRDEVLNQAAFNFYAPNERHDILSTLKEREQWRDVEFVSLRKNGEAYPAVLAFDFIEIEGGLCTIEVVRDLSAQKEAEEALRLSEEKFSKAFFASPDSVTISTLEEGVILEANQGFKDVFGYEPSDVIGQNVKDLNLYINLEDRQRVIEQLLREGVVRNFKLAARHKADRELMTNISMELMEFAGEQGIVTIVRDVTEQERMIEALRASEAKFATIFQFSPNALSFTNLETGELIEVNEGFERITGYTRDEALGATIGELGLYEEEWQRSEVRELFQQNGRLDDYEFVTRQKGGQTLFCTISGRLIHIGGVPYALVLVRDITEAKLAQEELQRSEALLRDTQKLAKLGSWSLDLVSGELYWSDVLYDLFGIPFSKSLTYDDYAAHVSPDELPMVESITAEAFRTGLDNFSFEHRIITADGTERYLWIQNYLDRDETGWVTRVHGTAQDISERKLTEDALFESEEMARAFQEKLRALHEVTIRLSNEPEIDTFCRLAIELGREELGFERLGLSLFDESQEMVYGMYGTDTSGRVQSEKMFSMRLSENKTVQELLRNNTRVKEWDDTEQYVMLEQVGRGWVTLTMLWDGDRGVGVLSADNYLTKAAPPPFAKDLMALYGNALGHLLTRKRADQSVERYVKQLQLLQQIDRAILRADSPAAMAQSVLQPLYEILDCHFIDIARYDGEKNIIYSLANTLDQTLDSEMFGSVSPEAMAQLAVGDILELDTQEVENRGEVTEFWYEQGVRSMLIVPLLDVELLGIFYIGTDDSNSLNEEQLSIVKQVATQLAIALRQNVLYQHVENYANQLEHLVEVRTNQLAQKAHELEAFTYSVSHDLRAPLRAMDGFSRMLVNNYGADLPDKAQHYLTRIQYNAKKMGRLIDDLLKLSRLGRQEMQFKKIDGPALVNSVIDELAENDQLEGAKIRVLTLPPFYGDDTLLKQVWFNLISNAIKYTQKGQRPEIEIGSLQQQEQTVYYIQDRGIGFDMAYVSKLFGVFQRLHNVADYDGTGIGLATVQRIIHRHGGRIWAEAEVNNGAAFYFTLEEQPKETTQSNAE